MINKRLLKLCGGSKKYISFTVTAKWVSLLCGIGALWAGGRIVDKILINNDISVLAVSVVVVCISVRFFAELAAPRFAHTAAAEAQKTLRKKVYDKLVLLGTAYSTHTTTAGIVQTAGEGIESLDSYFGKYLPQFFLFHAGPCYTFFILIFCFCKASRNIVGLRSSDSPVNHSFYENGEKSYEEALECLHRFRRHIS